MRNFRATVKNADGDTFQITFENENWNGVLDAAKAELARVVANDPLHQRFGPWSIDGIDVTA